MQPFLRDSLRSALASALLILKYVVPFYLLADILDHFDLLHHLGFLFAPLNKHALRLGGPTMPLGVAFGILFGLFSKESALVCVPLVPFAALLASPLTHPERPPRRESRE